MWLIIALWNVLSPAPADVEALRQMAPRHLSTEAAKKQLVAARIAGLTYRIEPDLLIGIAHAESGFNPYATSRRVDGVRTIGSWPSAEPGPGFGGTYFCGNLQAMAGMSWSRCLELREPLEGYMAGAQEMASWLKRAHGDVNLALAGHCCGNKGFDLHMRGVPSVVDRYIGKVTRARARFNGYVGS